jgi:hypothetical protein
MADGDVVIGSASVNIVGDYSGLEKSFQESQDLAQAAGQQIGAALESGAAGANALTASISGTTDALTGIVQPTAAAEAQLQALFAQGMSVSEAMAAMNAQTTQAAASEDALGAASTQAAAGVQGVGAAAAGAVPPLNDAAQASNSLLDSLLGFAATAITAAAIERIGEESIFAYGHLQQLTTSLDLMGAGAAGAAEKVEELKNLSVQLAVPFEDLAHQAQALAAQFGTGEGMTAVLIAAGNAAAATGKSFDSASAAIERIGVTGTVSARQLFALGLSWQDMADAMGVSIEEAQAKLKKGGQDAQQDVADVIEAINTKFGDAAERQAQNTLGIWTNLKNQAEFIFQEIGQNFAGIVDVFSGAMKVIASGLIAIIGGVQLVTVEVIGMVREAIEGIKGLGQVAAAVMSGDFAGAAIAAANAYSNIKTAAEYTDQSIQDHAKKTADQLQAIWSDSAKKISATFTPTGSTGGNDPVLQATRDKVKGFKDLTDQLSVWIAMEKLEVAAQQEVVNATAKWNEATGQLITTHDLLNIRLQEAQQKLADFYGGLKDVFGASQGWVDGPLPNLLAGVKELAPLMGELADETTAAAQAALDTSPYAKLEAALDSLGIKGQQYYKDLADKADAAYQVVLDSGVGTYNELAQAALRSVQAQIQLQLDLGQISRDEADKTLKQVQDDLNQLDASSAGSTKTRGKNERTLGDDIQAINKKTFDSLERGLADSIVNLKGFGDLWKTLWQGLAKDLLNIMFKVLLDPLEKAIGKVLGGVFGGAGSAAGTAAGGAASAGGSAASGAGGAASGAAGAVGSSLTGILTSVFTGLTAASSIFGNFQAAQSETTLNAIEESTRYLKIGLVTQGDSLLNDSHTIRNTLTDFMAWNWNVATTYFQGISEKLDTIIGMGGIHSSAVQSQVSTFALNKAVVADQSSNVTVNIDTVASDVTDTKVRDVFNRGIRMSKLAGAFPAGRFPQ